MDYEDRKKAAAEFAKKWSGRGYEKGETALFWTDFLRDIAGMEDVSNECRFEERTRDGGFIDAWLPDRGVIIEQKSSGIDLDKPEVRQGREVTPYQQALAYAQQMPLNQQPRWIVACNFETFRIHDRDKADPERDYVEVPLSRLSNDIAMFSFFSGKSARSVREQQASIKAGELIGKLHAALSAQYADPESDESQHALNVLCVRLVFCLYAEDSGLFGKDLLLGYLRQFEARHMRRALIDLFEVLNTPYDQRDPYLDDDLKRFPYVNGGLFKGEVEIPNFTDDIKTLLLLDVSLKTDWSTISPTIFGGVFESTLNPDTRRSGGMHYTSPENIHKVIDPLFLDDLKAEYRSIKEDAAMGDKRRRNRLLAFQDKLSSLSFFDPACGSGNFLTETYLCLRRLENHVLADLMNIRGKDRSAKQFTENQLALGFEDANTGDALGVKVNIAQFYGIEINDFAVRVAKTALWIAELQANVESEYVIQQDIEDLPLRDSANIVHGNALRLDWNEVLPAEKCDYIMGNPPFVGSSYCSKGQKEEIVELYGKIKLSNSLDYVSGWYFKAAEMMKLNPRATCAFVSTNSITQGEQVYPIWHTLSERFDISIDFAWKTFVWDSEAVGTAHVHCVIIGMSSAARPGASLRKTLFDENKERLECDNINFYLQPAPSAFVVSRGTSLCGMPKIMHGSKPSDGGNLILTEEEKAELVSKEPAAARFVRRYSGGVDFLRGGRRYCLWLVDAKPSDLKSMPLVCERVRKVAESRLSSSAKATQKKAETPTLFFTITQPQEGMMLVGPQVSSGRRKYIPFGYYPADVIASDKLLIMPSAKLFHFGVLSSQFHNAWVRVVAGRLKSDFTYSVNIVYNNFPWPVPSDTRRDEIESCAQAVLEARKLYPDSTLADMYDPDNEWMFPELTKAHKSLDAAVEAAYGVDFQGDEEKIVAHLFKLYAEMTGEE